MVGVTRWKVNLDAALYHRGMSDGRMLLLIADIGGYTRFMTVHRINLTHAQVIVRGLAPVPSLPPASEMKPG
jgi:hypothetical protein